MWSLPSESESLLATRGCIWCGVWNEIIDLPVNKALQVTYTHACMYMCVGTSSFMLFVSQLSSMASSCAKLSIKDPNTVLKVSCMKLNLYM